MKQDIQNYEHPYLTVDGVVLCYRNGIEVLLVRRSEQPEQGKWSLPGGFMNIDQCLDQTLERKVAEKTGVSGFYREQLKTYDALDRDPRGRILSVAYLALIRGEEVPGAWFHMNGNTLEKDTVKICVSDLAFDHGQILLDALDRMKNKLWYSDLVKYLLPEQFTIREAKTLFSLLGGRPTSMFRRDLGARVIEMEAAYATRQGRGRPAALFRWNPDWKGD